MIRPMRKVTVLGLAAAREALVTALRELGVLHVVMRPLPTAAGEKSAGGATAGRIEAVRQALAVLHALPDQPSAPAEAPAPSVGHDLDRAVARIAELHTQQALFLEEIEDLAFQREDQAPFGDFDPAVARRLTERGVRVTLFRQPTKHPFPSAPEYVALASRGGFRYGAALGTIPEGPGVETVPLPQLALKEIDQRVARGAAELRRIDRELHALAGLAPRLETCLEELTERREFERVADTLTAHGAVAHLDGFCPNDRVVDLQSAARRHGWALWVRDPDPDENVPVALVLPRWLRPIATLFRGLGILPGYREADVSAVFLPFFSLFFAMLIGDAGYGLLMLAAVIGMRRARPRAPAQPFWLFGVFAVATIVWGTLAGSYFAIDRSLLPRALRGIPWLTDAARGDANLMWLCFLIGGAHLTIAHLWNAIALYPSRKALAQVGWIGVIWLMFFVSANLVVGRPIPAAVPWIGGFGVLLVALFMTDPRDFKAEWINHPMLILNLISCLVDVISYIRLFAVGMASAQIAMNFNQMALGLPLPPWVRPLGVALILILGHGLNLVLGALSILVHAVRLNTLEFSNHKGLTWSGQPYAPFRKPILDSNA